MAVSTESTTEGWELFFNSLLTILDDCECAPGTYLEKEMLGVRLEQAVYALQQVVSLAAGYSESEAFPYELLINFRLLHIELSRADSATQCTHLPVYSLEAPPLSRAGSVGGQDSI